MAAPSIFDTVNLGAAVGNVEDLTGHAPYLYPSKAPVTALCSTRSSKSYFPDFTVKTLNDPDITPIGEGQDVTVKKDQAKKTGRYQNVITTLREEWSITKQQQAVENVDELTIARLEQDANVILNVSKEKQILSNTAKSTSDPLTAAGLWDQLSASPSVITDAEFQTPAESRITPSGNTLTEDDLNGGIDSIYNASGESENLFFFHDTALGSDFAKNATRLASTPTNAKLQFNIDGKAGYIPMVVKMWEGPHGAVMCKSLNPQTTIDQTNRDTGYILNPKYLEIRNVIGRSTEGPWDFGGGPYGAVEEDFCIIATNGKAHGTVDLGL